MTCARECVKEFFTTNTLNSTIMLNGIIVLFIYVLHILLGYGFILIAYFIFKLIELNILFIKFYYDSIDRGYYSAQSFNKHELSQVAEVADAYASLG